MSCFRLPVHKHQPFNQSIRQAGRQAINHSINQSINQSISQSIKTIHPSIIRIICLWDSSGESTDNDRESDILNVQNSTKLR